MADFYATIKLITGEEIFALVSVDSTEEQPVIITVSYTHLTLPTNA